MGDQAKTIALLNQKGGVGKTTLLFHLSYALNHLKQKVLCIDMDPQGNLSHLFGVPHEVQEFCPIFQLLLNSVRELRNFHRPYLPFDAIRNREGVGIIPSGTSLSGLELTLASIKQPRQLVLKNFIEKVALKEHFDFILIDGPPTLGTLMINILCASDGVLVPFRPDEFSQSGLQNFFYTLEEVEEMGIVRTPKVLGLIPNLVEGRRKLAQDYLEVANKNHLGKEFSVFAPISNRGQLEKACTQKKSIFEFSTKEFHELQEQFLTIAQKLLELK